MGFVECTIGEPGTVLLAYQTEADWLDGCHEFTESGGTDGGNDGERTGLEEEFNQGGGGGSRQGRTSA